MDNNFVPSGFLFVDKPIGPTSHDVVAIARKRLKKMHDKKVKVGHGGTLDPLASGLLILGVGKSTKQLGELLGRDKTYECTITLGATTETDDAEGEPRPTQGAVAPTVERINEVLKTFVGTYEQLPPVYSAKKQKGTPQHKLARQGKIVERKAKTITMYSLKNLGYTYPELTLRVHCSSGTYIRSLARDIGKALRVGGYISMLRRIHIGKYAVTEAQTMESIKTDDLIFKTIETRNEASVDTSL